MRIISAINEMQRTVDDVRRQDKLIGLVPTMGYIHEGHLSLVRIAKQNSHIVITSIFVNPTQFDSDEDFARYPRDIERDKQLAESAGSDILFLPEQKEMYHADYLTYVEVKKITEVLEGKFRPTHFLGVTTIVAKLFNITKPHIAVFGQKDAQQALVVKQMVKDLNIDLKIVVAPIIREESGLAMSSRNVYLSPKERNEGTVLHRSLRLAERLIRKGERHSIVILSEMKKMIASQSSAQIDYVSIADPTTLKELSSIDANEAVLVSLAVRIGSTRLLDNLVIKV